MKLFNCFQGGISSSNLSVFFTDNCYKLLKSLHLIGWDQICQWKTLTKRLMKCPPGMALRLLSLRWHGFAPLWVYYMFHFTWCTVYSPLHDILKRNNNDTYWHCVYKNPACLSVSGSSDSSCDLSCCWSCSERGWGGFSSSFSLVFISVTRVLFDVTHPMIGWMNLVASWWVLWLANPQKAFTMWRRTWAHSCKKWSK